MEDHATAAVSRVAVGNHSRFRQLSNSLVKRSCPRVNFPHYLPSTYVEKTNVMNSIVLYEKEFTYLVQLFAAFYLK